MLDIIMHAYSKNLIKHGNREQGVGSREQGVGSREQGAGSKELEIKIKIKN